MKSAILLVLCLTLAGARLARSQNSGCSDVQSSTWCNSKKDKCAEWKDHMVTNCQLTCGYCDVCQDDDERFCVSHKDRCVDVPSWRNFMKKYCRKTCGHCSPGSGTRRVRRQSGCYNVESTNWCNSNRDMCVHWKDYMVTNCQLTCGYCDVCQDDDVSFCVSHRDKCTSYPSWRNFMKDYCKKTCGQCNPAPSPTPIQPTCGKKGRSHSRIVGGDIASPGDWPWQVTYNWVGNTAKPGHWCGASIISPNWIVTAAHCFGMSNDAADYTLTVGDFDIGKPDEGHEQKMEIEKIITHERYDSSNYDYDIALIKLRNAITYTERVKPICLPPAGMDFDAGTVCVVTGWGKLDELGEFPKKLYQAKVPLVDRKICADTYKTHHGYIISDRMRCAGFTKGKIDACQGDSGGPMVCEKDNRWYLMGAVSWGVGCARENAYGVYADLTVLRSWVENTVRNN